MHVSWGTTALISLCLLSCLHHSPRQSVMEALSVENGEWLFAGKPAPEYLGFENDASARVFSGLRHTGVYRIAPKGQPLSCPGEPGVGNHGYVLGARVNRIMGDTALATIIRTCAFVVPECPSGAVCGRMGGGAIRYTVEYLLGRNGGRWRVIKPIGASVTMS